MSTYAFALGPMIYEGPGKDGAPLTLVRAMQEVYGVGEARVLRLSADGTAWETIIRNAGSSCRFTHEPTGRIIRRRKVGQRMTY